ncbi:MAG TPA: LEA type 2 family protein [Gemmatimonadaceae bacterium]|nr:LEA type 2 family protein [Gemmatimonadaceae bacterium]
MRTRNAGLCFVALVAIAACATFGRGAFQQPVVTLSDVQINGVGLTGGALDVVLNVYNPNGYRLDATKLTYEVLVDSVRFGTGVADSKFTVQDNDSTKVRLPLDFTWAGVGQAGRDLLNMGVVNYRVRGELTVGTPAGELRVPYDRTGRYSTLSGTSK